ncbi:hypothetical protein HELRODRAFT_128720, partial [Helobdella robusta]|uniref:Homeobox domain-containing protein n=1 Tax=Helobdella robusta TaxID=6412 RepID=T1EHQ3_HELRO
RRQRSTFSKSQVKCLEDVFKTVHYVDAGLRMKLSRQLNLSEGTINIWFQNRR